MQVTNSATVVDYYPEAFVAEADDIKGMKTTVKRFIKRVYFRANGTRSYSVVTASDARYDWESRINNGATVTDFNTEKMNRSEYMPLICWGMSFLSNFTYSKLMQTSNNSINRDSLQDAFIQRIIDGMDHKDMYQLVYDNLNGNFDDYTTEELITEVEDYYPELLEQDNDWSYFAF